MIDQRPLGAGGAGEFWGAGEGKGTLGCIGMGPAPRSCCWPVTNIISSSRPMGREQVLARVPESCAGSGAGQSLLAAGRSRARALAKGWVERSVP